MIAIRVKHFGGPEALEPEELPDLRAGPGQVLIHTHAIGVNPVETYVRSGNYPKLPTLPYTPGADAAGVIAEIGEGVRGLQVNDWVYTYGTLTGAYASQILCTPEQVHLLPERVSFAQGATVGIACGAAWRALFHRGNARAGETVLIHGATGGVGTAAVQLAVESGLTVIGTSGSADGREMLVRLGAHHVMGHEEANDPERMRSASGGNGVDLTIEMLANVNLGHDLAVMNRNGRIVVVGSRGPVEIDPRLTMGSELTILGMSLNNATQAEVAEMHAALGRSMASGSLRPIVGTEYPIADAAEAHRAVMGGHSAGNIVLTLPQT